VGFKTEQLFPVNLFHRTPLLMVVRKDSPFKTVKEFVEAAKKDPGKIKIGATGTNGLGHVAAMRIRKLAGITTEYVPFTGNAPLMTALLGGHIDVAITVSSDAVAYQDRAISLGIASEQRLDILPEVPTLKEQGIDFAEASYRGVAVPMGTPEPIAKKLEKVFLDSVCKNPDYVDTQKKGGYEPVAMGIEETKALIAKGTAMYRDVFAEMGLLKK
jgi:tripartite-type tricarboxylate transporter receptor subunit TctC